VLRAFSPEVRQIAPDDLRDRRRDEPDVLREGVRVLAQALMEAEVTAQVGAEPYERSGLVISSAPPWELETPPCS
jgi:transposase-like protein